MHARFIKLNTGDWGIRVDDPTVAVGQLVEVCKASGEARQVVVTRIVAKFNDAALATFEDTGKAKKLDIEKPQFKPTPEQEVALDLFLKGLSIAIKAGAGTGKTSTLGLLSREGHKAGRHGQYIAFNAAIVEESGGKFPASVACNTAHSLAMRAVGGPFRARMDSGERMKSHEIAAALGIREGIWVTKYNDERKQLSPTFLAGLVMKAIKKFCTTADLEPTAKHVPQVDGLDAPHDPTRPTSHPVNNEVARAIQPYVQRAWKDLTMYQGKLPFTKDIAFATCLKLWQLSSPRINADYIMFDEAQDANPVMVDVISKQTHAQLIWVGDDNQQIYSFTGAINALATVPHDDEAYLTQSFRFGQAIADVANTILATLPTPMRLTGFDQIDSTVGALTAPRAILTRTNATAMRHVLTALSEERVPYLVGGGKDVAAFCRAARDLQAGLRTDHPELAPFSTWLEVQEYVENDELGGDLKLMVQLIDEFGAEVILNAVNGCAKETDADVIISTAHKAKGREWDSVQIGADFPEAAKAGDEERRLLYVAVTRAKVELDITGVPYFEEVAAA